MHAEALATALGEILVTKQDRDLATKDDLHLLELATKEEFATVRQELGSRFEMVGSEFAAVRQEMGGRFEVVGSEFAAVRQESGSEFAALRHEMNDRFTGMEHKISTLHQEMRALELRITIRLGALGSIGFGALAALLELT